MSMPDTIEARLSALLATLEPSERRALTKDIARRLRESQAKRIAAQQNPDGSAYEPRKPRLRKKTEKGTLRKTMFAKMRTAKYLKMEPTANAAVLTFVNQVQRMARVHQLGLRDRVEHIANAPTVKYPVRELLGFTDPEIEMVERMVTDHLAQG
jgi:phage virion morphogenesis protein